MGQHNDDRERLSNKVKTGYRGDVEQPNDKPDHLRVSFQRGTRWMPGLSDQEMSADEDVLTTKFPLDFRTFLRAMNGTDLPTLNVCGSSGAAPLQSVAAYSYPRDVEVVKQLIGMVEGSRDGIDLDLESQGFHLPAQASLVPICGQRYVVCTRNLNTSVVLSIVVHDVDAIINYEWPV